MEYIEEEIVFAMGNWFRVKKVTGPESCELDLLTIEEARAHEMKLMRDFQEEKRKKEREINPVYSFRIRYNDGVLSREFRLISKAREFAKRKQNVKEIVKLRNDVIVGIVS